MVEEFINKFKNEVRNPNIFAFSLILSNAFDGTILMKNNNDNTMVDYVVLIDDLLYDIFGVVNFKDIDIENYKAVNAHDFMLNIKLYNSIKWFFINEMNEDELYHRDIC
jgi:hypothetical protein